MKNFIAFSFIFNAFGACRIPSLKQALLGKNDPLNNFNNCEQMPGQSIDLQVVSFSTQVWQDWQKNAATRNSIKIAQQYHFHSTTARMLSGNNSLYEMIKEKTFVVRVIDAEKCIKKLNRSEVILKDNTFCKSIYNDHCLICSKQYQQIVFSLTS